MAKTKLFDLIKSMSMSEKRFFKLFSSRHVIGEENEYVHLFDLIESMAEYDDKLVKEAPFVKNSSAEKNYLYRLILKSLNTFHNQSNTKNKIYNMLISVEVLFQKGLYEQCLELIEKTKKLALEHELFKQLLTINEIEQEVLLKGLNYKQALSSMENEENLLKNINELRDIGMLTTQAYYENLSIGVARSEKQLQKYQKLIESQSKEKPSSKRAKLHQKSFAMTYNMMAGKPIKVISQSKDMIQFYENNPLLIEYTPIGYVSVNFIHGAAIRQHAQYDKALKQVFKLEDIAENKYVKKSQKAQAFAVFYKNILFHQLLYLEDRFEDALSLYEKTKEEIRPHLAFIEKPQLYDLYFQFSKLFFVTGKHGKTLDYTNIILNDLKFKDRDDFSICVRLFNIITHFELGNEFTIEYLSKSSISYLRRKDKLYESEHIIIKFLQNYSNYKFKGDHIKKGQALKAELKKLRDDPYEKGAFRLFAFDHWITGLIPDTEKGPVSH